MRRRKDRGPYIDKNPWNPGTFADIIQGKLKDKKMKRKVSETKGRIIDTLILAPKPQKVYVVDTLVLKDKKELKHTDKKLWAKEKWPSYFENVELINVQEAKDLAREHKFILTLWYKGKKLLGYLKDAKNIPRNQRIFKIEEGDRLSFPDGMLRFCDGERFIHYDEDGEEELSVSV